jgi:uncharacterized protein (TIGR02117 family)
MSLFKKIATVLISLISLILLYFLIANLLVFFPSQSINSTKQQYKVYILYGEIHSDIVLNINDLNASWFKKIQPIQNKNRGYLAIGWGDKESYLHPGTVETLPLETVFKALFINTSSLLRVSYHENITHYKHIKAIPISQEQLSQLHRNLFKDFDFNKKDFNGYHHNDHFYGSHKTYNAIHTCNTWTGNHLRKINIPMSYWTPLKENVIDSLP